MGPSACRRSFRVPLRAETARRTDRPRFLGYVGNLSTSGAFVQSLRPRPPGTRLTFRIHLPQPGSDPLDCIGEVVWVRGTADRELAPGMGIRFRRVAPPGVEALARVCRTRSP